MDDLALLDDATRLRVALTPLRRQILRRLRDPASATMLATEFGLPRQRLNYHLRTLEQAGLIRLVEERPRRGCVERILAAAAHSFAVDPDVIEGEPAAVGPVDGRAVDGYAADELVRSAAATVREVARMREHAAGRRLLTFAVEARVRFAEPGDVHRFTDQLYAALERLVADFDTPTGRPYRLTAGGHPAVAGSAGTGDASPADQSRGARR